MAMRHYRIFISSPSDVRPERAIAERITAKLAGDFAHHCEISPVLWEREPLLASRHFQDFDNIPPPSTTDICVVIVWSTLGVPLPADKFLGAISGNEVTGTEWEFEDALHSLRERGTPDLLFYQKTAETVVSLSDEPALDAMLRQKRAVDDFIARWFRSADGRGFTSAYHPFATTAEFETRLDDHLRALLLRRLERDLGLDMQASAVTWTGAPWPALSAFGPDQAPVFFGRSRARFELRELLAARARAKISFVLVIGASGSGKSSLIRAGLLPDLMLPGMVGPVGLVRYGIMRPTDAAGDTIRALARALMSPSALPELAALGYQADALAAQLRQDPRHAVAAVAQGLAAAAEGRLTRHGQARLALVIDQLEELLTTDRIAQAERDIFATVVEALARSGQVWLLGTMRADLFGRLQDVPSLAALAEGGLYLLLPPTLAELAEIVAKPAQAAGLRFELSRATGERLDSAIVAAASRDAGALPLLSFVLDALWREPRDGVELSFAAYERLGRLEGAIAQHAETIVSSLPDGAREALPNLLLSLVSVPAGEGQATGRACLSRDLAQTPHADLVIARLVAARLLIADETADGTALRLAHEALLTSWPRLAGLIADRRESLAAMTRLRSDLAEWERSGQPADLLLPAGKRLSEGMELLQRRPQELSDGLAGFIEASAKVAFAARRRRRRLIASAFATLLVLTSAAGLGAWFGLSGRFAAEASRNALQRQFAIAEGRRAQVLALALTGEADPGTVQKVALTVLPHRAIGRADPYATLADRLVIAANGNAQRLVIAGHGNAVTTAMFSPDGRFILTGSLDATARTWDARTGVPVRTFSGHKDAIECATYSPDGRRVATASDDGTAVIWDAATGARLLTLTGHAGSVNSVDFSPDGRRIATASEDKTARIWDAATGALLATLTHGNQVSQASFSHDGRRIVTASLDKTARIWDAASGRALKTLVGHTSFVMTAAFSPDGAHVVTASGDKTVRVWDAASGVQLLSLGGNTNGLSFASFSADGTRIATAGADKTARIWDAHTGLLLRSLAGHDNLVTSVLFSPDGTHVVTASVDRTARVWDIAHGAQLFTLTGHTDFLRTGVFSEDGARIVTASMDGTAKIWDAATGALRATLTGHQAGLLSAAFSPNGTRVVTSALDTTARVWDAATGRLLVVLPGNGQATYSVAYSPDGRHILLASNDKTARVIDASTGKTLVTLTGHKDWVRRAIYSNDQQRIATASVDGTVRLWNATTGALQMTLDQNAVDVVNVAFSKDGARLVTGSADGTARLWDATHGVLLHILTGHDASIRAASFTPDGRRVVTASVDGTARIWDAATGAPLMVLSLPGVPIRDAEFSPDGHRLLTVSDDGLGRVWDAPDYLDASDIGFIGAITSRALDATMRAKYALDPPPARPKPVRTPGCTDDPACQQQAAEHDENAADERAAFLHHAIAARLFELAGNEAAAQHERYRREALAWMLPRATVAQLMNEASAGE